MIGAIIVAFNPDLTQFAETVDSVLDQVDQLTIVNNSEYAFHQKDVPLSNKVTIINNKENLGVGSAINIGIKSLLSNGCTYFLFLDQDSKLSSGMVKRLHNSFITCSQSVKLAAVGPVYYDTGLKKLSPFLKSMDGKLDLIYGDPVHSLNECDFIITSGTFTSSNVIEAVGLMDETLFVDHIDHEWCLRAVSMGYKILGNSSIVLLHAIGGEPLQIRGRLFHSHAPIRYYYLIRNTILLLKRDYIPKFWKVFFVRHMILSFFIQGFFSKQKLKKVMYMFKGLIDGVLNRSGSY